MSKEKKLPSVLIIGGGISGLASAALLAKRGHNVTLLEKNNSLGGRARVFSTKGFQFDMGPSWYMMPEVFERFFAHFDKNPTDFYELKRLDPSYKIFFEGQESVVVPANIDETVELFERIEDGAGKHFLKYLERSKRQYELATQKLIYQDTLSYKTWFSPKNFLNIFWLLLRTNIFTTWSTYLQQSFEDERLLKILSFPAVFLGGSPYTTPSLFSILSWADFGKGIWYPMGGMKKVVQALEVLCREAGVNIVLNAEVDSIKLNESTITSVQANNIAYKADVVVHAGDLAHLESKLLPKKYQTYSENYWKKKTLGISAVLVYLGVRKRIPEAVHHTLYFTHDWQKNFDAFFKEQRLPEQPSFYVSIRSASDPDIAPKNHEELFVLIPVPSSTKVSRSAYEEFAEQAIIKLEKILGVPLLDDAVVKRVYTPHDFESDYLAYQGTALGLAHTLEQSLIFRPGNKSKKIRNLYYAGQYTNPGVGVPMALISGEIVANMIHKP